MALFKQKVKLEKFCEYTFRRSLGSKEIDDYYKNMFKDIESYEKNFKEIESFLQLTTTLLFISQIIYCYKTGWIKGPINFLEKRMVDSAEKIYNEFEYNKNPNQDILQYDFIDDINVILAYIASGEDINNFTDPFCDYLIEKYESRYDELGFSVGYFIKYEIVVVMKTMANNMSEIKIIN